jgi:hypothetical protein
MSETLSLVLPSLGAVVDTHRPQPDTDGVLPVHIAALCAFVCTGYDTIGL